MPRKTLPARITYEWLKRRGACELRLKWFRETFPRGVGRITARHIAKAGMRDVRPFSHPVHWLIAKALGTYFEPCPICTNRIPVNATAIAKYLRDRQRES